MTPGLVCTVDNAKLEAEDICASVLVMLLGSTVKVSISLFTSARSKQTMSSMIPFVMLLVKQCQNEYFFV